MRKFLLGMVLTLVAIMVVGVSVSLIMNLNGNIDDVYNNTVSEYEYLEMRLEWLDEDVDYLTDYVEWLEESLLEAVLLNATFANYESELRSIREEFQDLDPAYTDNYDELMELYIAEILEEFPDIFEDRDSLVISQELLTIDFDTFVVDVTYYEDIHTIFIEDVEICYETCEVIDDFEQTDFVMTIEELESFIRTYIEDYISN